MDIDADEAKIGPAELPANEQSEEIGGLEVTEICRVVGRGLHCESCVVSCSCFCADNIGTAAQRRTAPAYCHGSPWEIVPARVTGDGYAAPSDGAITSWSTAAALGAGQEFVFKIYHPLGEIRPSESRWLVMARDARALTPGVVNTFKVDIPIQTGDVIGDNDANADVVPNACFFETGDLSEGRTDRQGEFFPGSEFTGGSILYNVLPNVSATFLPTPKVNALSLSQG